MYDGKNLKQLFTPSRQVKCFMWDSTLKPITIFKLQICS